MAPERDGPRPAPELALASGDERNPVMAEPGESLERLGDSSVVIRPDRVGIRSRHVAVEEDGDEAVQPLREAGRPLVCHGRDQARRAAAAAAPTGGRPRAPGRSPSLRGRGSSRAERARRLPPSRWPRRAGSRCPRPRSRRSDSTRSACSAPRRPAGTRAPPWRRRRAGGQPRSRTGSRSERERRSRRKPLPALRLL